MSPNALHVVVVVVVVIDAAQSVITGTFVLCTHQTRAHDMNLTAVGLRCDSEGDSNGLRVDGGRQWVNDPHVRSHVGRWGNTLSSQARGCCCTQLGTVLGCRIWLFTRHLSCIPLLAVMKLSNGTRINGDREWMGGLFGRCLVWRVAGCLSPKCRMEGGRRWDLITISTVRREKTPHVAQVSSLGTSHRRMDQPLTG